MKSSGPLFTKQNPFQSASRVGKMPHHPSCNQSLSKKKKKTALSPVRSKQEPSPRARTLSPDRRDHGFNATDERPVFSEIWPSTDRESDMETPKQSARAGKSTASSELGADQDSVLGKYVERFRHGRPQSREERLQTISAVAEQRLSFWWMSPSSSPPSSTPTKTAHKDQVTHPQRGDRVSAIFSPAGQRRRDRSPSPGRGSLSILSDTSQGEFDDTEIIHLQDRASRLLLRGEHALSDGSVPVSSDGIGGSDFSSPVSVDEPMRRPLIPSLIKSSSVKNISNPASSQTSVIPPSTAPTRPEEDILFQWRLRRKMEQAREWPQSLKHSKTNGHTFSWQAPSLGNPPSDGQIHKQQQRMQPPEFSRKDVHQHITAPQPEARETHRSGPPPSPAFIVSEPQALTHVPAHMHLLCDVLPCPIQSSHANTQRLDEFQTKTVSKKTQVLSSNPTDLFTDEPIREHRSSSTRASCGAAEEEQLPFSKTSERHRKEKIHTKESEKNEKTTTASVKKQKKPTRYTVDKEHSDACSATKRSSSHQRLPKKVTPPAELQQQERSQSFTSESCAGDHAPPPSPIRSALGQVVSEVLFPSVESSPARRLSDSLVSPTSAASAPPQSPLPPCATQSSMEVISQLLQEAEDSDETEFGDDTLLQVLRKQRQWVKEQISEVDSLLNEFLDEKQVT